MAAGHFMYGFFAIRTVLPVTHAKSFLMKSSSFDMYMNDVL